VTDGRSLCGPPLGGGYGAGFTRSLKTAGIDVVDVDRPTRFDRRRAGKSDRLDAYHAARAVLAERSNPVKGPAIEGVRALHLARRSAVKAQTAAMNQMIAILVMAPETVRARYRRLHGDRLAIALTSWARGVVVHDQMQLLVGVAAGEVAEKDQELLVPVPRLATTGDLAGSDLERGEQHGGAAPHVVMSAFLGLPGLHRQRVLRRSKAWI
jgi:transposase